MNDVSIFSGGPDLLKVHPVAPSEVFSGSSTQKGFHPAAKEPSVQTSSDIQHYQDDGPVLCSINTFRKC